MFRGSGAVPDKPKKKKGKRRDLRAQGPERLLRRPEGRQGRLDGHPRERDHGADRPLGLRQEHPDPLPQPDERPDPDRDGRGPVLLPRAGPLRQAGRSGRGPQADRDGVPEAEPVPEVDLRQHRLRPAGARPRQRRGAGRAGPAPRRALGRGQGPARHERLRDVRRPAAAPLHRPLHRRRPRRDPDGRALLGARPDLDREDRGPDAAAQGRVLDRDRHPQHAAGGAGLGQDRVPDRRAVDVEEKKRWGQLVEYDVTDKIFTNPKDRTEDYVTGKVG